MGDGIYDLPLLEAKSDRPWKPQEALAREGAIRNAPAKKEANKPSKELAHNRQRSVRKRPTKAARGTERFLVGGEIVTRKETWFGGGILLKGDCSYVAIMETSSLSGKHWDRGGGLYQGTEATWVGGEGGAENNSSHSVGTASTKAGESNCRKGVSSFTEKRGKKEASDHYQLGLKRGETSGESALEVRTVN